MKTNSTTTKLLRTASAALILALVPGIAAADTTMAEGPDTLKLALGSVPGTVLDTTLAARAAGGGGRYEVGSVWLGGTIGPQFGSGFTAFRITAEVQATLAELGPRAYFDLAGHWGGIFGGVGFGNLAIIEFIPAARFRFVLQDKVSLYGDFGIGPAFAIFSFPAPFSGTTEVWGNFRIAGGIQYRVTPTVALWAEPLGMNIYFGSGSEFMYSLAFGALFRI